MNLKKNLLNIEHLRISHGENVLVDVAFAVNCGETLGIVGSSGAGKSLTAQALAHILPDNLQMQLLSSSKPKIGYVFQDPLSALNPLMSIGNQIDEVLRDKVKTCALLDMIGLSGQYDKVPFQLSGGMRQRGVIGIALAQNPELLICDEATSSLDLATQEQILTLLQKIHQENGFSLILITHDWSTVLRMCQRVLVMEGGRIVEMGAARALLANPSHAVTRRLIEACAPF